MCTNGCYRVALVAGVLGMSGGLLAQVAGRGGAAARGPHVVEAGVDARFGVQYNNTNPSGLGAVADYPDAAAWERRAEFLRHQVMVANGIWPLPEKTPLNAVVHGKVEKEDFTIEKVYFQSMPGHYVTGNLYRPKNIKAGEKVPAILTPYGHWGSAPNNGRFWWRTDAEVQTEITAGGEKSPEGARSPLQETCMNLAHMGCVVLEWDLVGFCDSSVIKHQEGFTDTAAVLRLQSFMGLQTWNGIRAMDFVLSLPEVDPARVCVTGSSGGATQTMQLGATDSRIAATFAIVMVDMHNQGGCICENAPLLRVGTNNVEIATLSAPRPQGDCGGARDNTGDFETNGFPFMKHMYELLGKGENAAAYTIPFGHNHNVHSRELLYGFVNKTFKLGVAEPVVEKAIAPVAVKELSVWDEGHKLPGDFLGAPALREGMTKRAEEQMAGLEKDLVRYREVERVALEAMVSDRLPAGKDVECTADLGAATWRGFLGRKGAGERVPCVGVRPANWNGTVVVWADPQGVAGVVDGDGKPTAAVGKVLATGVMVVGIDVFMSGTFTRAVPLGNAAGMRNNYSAYANGYERTILGNRVHDLLSAIGLARRVEGVKAVRVVGVNGAGVQALLAAAVAGEAVERVAVDLGGFDFDQVTGDGDGNFLPGAVKYGGIYGLACAAQGKVMVAGAREVGRYAAAARAGVVLEKGGRSVEELVAWVLR